MVNISEQTIRRSSEKTKETMAKDFVRNLLVNLVFVGTFALVKYVPMLAQYRCLVRIDSFQNGPEIYDDLVQRFKYVMNAVEKFGLSKKLWINLQEDSNEWIIWTQSNMKFGNYLCKIAEVQFLENEMRVELVVIEAITPPTIALNTEDTPISHSMQYIESGDRFEYTHSKDINAMSSTTLTILVEFIFNICQNIQDCLHYISKSAYLLKDYVSPVYLIISKLLREFLARLVYDLRLILHFSIVYCFESHKEGIDCLCCSSRIEPDRKIRTFKCFCNNYKYLNKNNFMKHLTLRHGIKYDISPQKNVTQVDKDAESFGCICNSYKYPNKLSFIKHLAFKHGFKGDFLSKKDDSQMYANTDPFRCFCNSYKYPNKNSLMKHLAFKHCLR